MGEDSAAIRGKQKLLTESLKCFFNAGGNLFYGTIAVYLFKSTLFTVVFDDRSSLGFEGLHAFYEDLFRIIGPLYQSGTIYIADTVNSRRV